MLSAGQASGGRHLDEQRDLAGQLGGRQLVVDGSRHLMMLDRPKPSSLPSRRSPGTGATWTAYRGAMDEDPLWEHYSDAVQDCELAGVIDTDHRAWGAVVGFGGVADGAGLLGASRTS